MEAHTFRAKVRVDHEIVIPLRDGGVWALGFTGAAVVAVSRNFVRHGIPPVDYKFAGFLAFQNPGWQGMS
jgi:hypothetical protein